MVTIVLLIIIVLLVFEVIRWKTAALNYGFYINKYCREPSEQEKRECAEFAIKAVFKSF